MHFRFKADENYQTRNYNRRLISISQNPSSKFPIDARPSIWITPADRFLFDHNIWTTDDENSGRWGTIASYVFGLDKTGAGTISSSTFVEDVKVEKGREYDIDVEWKASGNKWTATIKIEKIPLENAASNGVSVVTLTYSFYADRYFCSKNTDMKVVLGEAADDYKAYFVYENIEGRVSDLTISNVCPIVNLSP